jgi:hypothetical protein
MQKLKNAGKLGWHVREWHGWTSVLPSMPLFFSFPIYRSLSKEYWHQWANAGADMTTRVEGWTLLEWMARAIHQFHVWDTWYPENTVHKTIRGLVDFFLSTHPDIVIEMRFPGELNNSLLLYCKERIAQFRRKGTNLLGPILPVIDLVPLVADYAWCREPTVEPARVVPQPSNDYGRFWRGDPIPNSEKKHGGPNLLFGPHDSLRLYNERQVLSSSSCQLSN